MSPSVTITLTHPGQILFEPIRGFVSVAVNSPTFIKGISVHAIGTYYTHFTKTIKSVKNVNGKSEVVEEEVEEYVQNIFYRSDDYPILEELHRHDTKLITELAPGEYKYPFIIQLPNNLPSSCYFKGKRVRVDYKLIGTIIYDSNALKSGTPITLPLCINTQRHNPQPTMLCDTNQQTDLKIGVSDVYPSVGDQLEMNVLCFNKCSRPLFLNISVIATHNYKNTFIQYNSPAITIGPIQTLTSFESNVYLDIPLDIPNTFHQDTFQINTYIKVEGKTNSVVFEKLFPITIGFDVPTPELMMQRSKYFGGKRDFTKTTGFYGSHFRMPPSYEEIQKNLPVGFEQIEMENGLTYYANHFTRTTSYAIDIDDRCNIPYPLYNASMLPSGWSLGKSYGEWYFIDHNTHQTSWVDPRPLEMRTIPHVEKKKKAKFTVQVIKAIGLPVLGWGNPDPYCCMKDINGKWVNTDVVNKMLDADYQNKRNTIEITIDKDRENAVLYVYDYHRFTFDVFMGGVNFDLQYFPPNVVIEDWFGLDNFGDKSRAVTGKVLLRVCYHVDDNINPPLAQIKGHSIINLDYYPDTRLIRDQIKKQDEVRNKLNLRENPMLDYEGTIICESI